MHCDTCKTLPRCRWRCLHEQTESSRHGTKPTEPLAQQWEVEGVIDESHFQDGMTAHERRVIVAEELSRLSPMQYECLRLALELRLRPKAISDLLGISRPSVREHLARAMERLASLTGNSDVSDLWPAGGGKTSPSIVGGEFQDFETSKSMPTTGESLKPQKTPNKTRIDAAFDHDSGEAEI